MQAGEFIPKYSGLFVGDEILVIFIHSIMLFITGIFSYHKQYKLFV